MKNETNPMDELARESENLRRAKERHATVAGNLETAARVLKKAQEDETAAAADVERYRERVRKLAAQVG